MTLIDGHEVEFGRIPSPPDTRDRLYPMSAALPPTDTPLPVERFWQPPDAPLNQNGWPECVAFAWRHWGGTSPVRTPHKLADARELYAECKRRDGYAGDGTWVRVALQILQERGVIGLYRWAETMDDIRRWVLLNGSVVVGTPWYEGMSNPINNVMRPTGAMQGGHAYLLIGYDSVARRFRVLNSWGTWWGDSGQAWIGEDDLWSVLRDWQGEAAAAEEVAVSNDGVDVNGWFNWAKIEPGPVDRQLFYNRKTPIAAIFHHSREGAGTAYSVLDDPARFPTAYTGEVRYEGELAQHYDVWAALVASNDGNFTGPAFELEGGLDDNDPNSVDEPATPAQVATFRRIHRDLAALTGRSPKRVTGQLSYADLQRIPSDELWLLEHSQVGPTACPSGRYAPLWAAIEEEEAQAVKELEDLILSNWGAVGEETLPRAERLVNARYRMQEAVAGRLQPLAGQIAEHTAKKAGAHQ